MIVIGNLVCKINNLRLDGRDDSGKKIGNYPHGTVIGRGMFDDPFPHLP